MGVKVNPKFARQAAHQEKLVEMEAQRAAKAAAKGAKAPKKPLTAKASTKTTANDKKYFSSKPTREFKEILLAELERNAREQLDIRVQGYILSTEAILDDIKDKLSPFKWEGSNPKGKIFDDDELPAIAEEISETLFNELKRVPPRGANVIDVTGNSPEKIVERMNTAAENNGKNKSQKKAVGFDHTKRVIYYTNKFRTDGTSDKFGAFTGYIKNRMKHLISSNPPSSNIVTYLKPDEDWLRLKDRIRAELDEQSATKSQRTARYARELKSYQKETGKVGYEGTHFGHTFGAAATKATAFLSNKDDLSHTYDKTDDSTLRIISGFSKFGEEEIKKAVKAVIDNDTRIEFEREYSSQDVHGTLTLFMNENAVSNTISGSSTSSKIRALKNLIKRIDQVIMSWDTSPTFNQMIVEVIEGAFFGLKTPRQKFTGKTRLRSKTNATINYSTPKGFKGKAETSEPKNRAPNNNSDLSNLIGFINSRLEDKIRENMGKGGSKQILNYRTGRFAKSAKVQSVYAINEKRALGAAVKYMRNPYGVFEPGGRLHKPGRDPHRIFGRSIRQILQEEKIANLRRVKVKLNG